jgi:putative ABC transport system permease protein
MISDNFKLAFKNLSQRRLRSWLTMIGIFIGIASVVSLIGLGQGLRIAITSQFDFLGTDILSVQASGNTFGPPSSSVPNALSDDLVDKIEKINGVEASYNRYIASGKLEFNDKQVIGLAASIPMGEDRKLFEKMLNLKTQSGRMLKQEDNKRLVLGSSFSDDSIFGKSVNAGDKVLLNDVKFEVIGVLEKKGNFMIDGSVLLNENTLLDLTGDDGTTDIIAVKVKDEKNIDKVKFDIEKFLRKERDVKIGEEDFAVTSPQAMLEALDSVLIGVNIFVFIIAAISLLVGGIGIMNTMYTAVLERTNEIGIMKAIGATNSSIFLLFFIESGFLGLVGGIIGILLGVLLAYGMSAIGRIALGSDLIQASVPMSLIIGSLCFSFILGTFFGVIPAYQASKLQPVEALRKK